MQRFNSLDALRGIAVILMVEQHLGYWFWAKSGLIINYSDHPFLIGFNAMGGFAAPAFIMLAGAGSEFFIHRHRSPDKILFARGLAIIGFGYLLNLMVSSWFSIGTWYVLHMIGFAVIISILLRRLSIPALLSLIIVILVATVIIQNSLNTPFWLDNAHMRNYRRPWGILILALAESQFPVLPWLAIFITGIIAGRLIINGKVSKILIMASSFMLIGSVMAFLYKSGFAFAKSAALHRGFRIFLGFYPASPPIIMILASLVLFTIYIFFRLEQKNIFKPAGTLVCLGRSSLTILITHIVIFREFGLMLRLHHIFSANITLVIIISVLILYSTASVYWSRIHYRFGSEWAVRKIAG